MTQPEKQPRTENAITYETSGVDTQQAETAISAITKAVRQTFDFAAPGGKPVLDLGYFANVLDLDGSLGLAISTDSAGTKVLIAQRVGRYDTIGIDCVAMNVNDLLCVGARPTSLVDYVAVEQLDNGIMQQIIQGLHEAARQSHISIPGGEIAQMADCIRGEAPGSGMDLVGTAVGLVALDQIIVGDGINEGDVLIGMSSSGLHSNGYTLARKVFFDHLGWEVDREVSELGETLGEALLRPTRIYVDPVLEMLKSDVSIKSLAHITGDGLLNLLRTRQKVGFQVHTLPKPPAIFSVLQRGGGISDAEMYRVFNMGIGFCVLVAPEGVDSILATAEEHGVDSWVLGNATLAEEHVGHVQLLPLGLSGDGSSGTFSPE